MLKRALIASALLLGITLPLQAAPKAPAKSGEAHPVFTDPGNAGPDFAFQGEYTTAGDVKQKYGADVVALGDDQFQVVLLPGGLPGDGYDGRSRTELRAKRDGDAIKIESHDGYSGSIANGTLTLQTPNGALEFKKVMRESPDAGAKPPEGATVLFDGSNTDAWKGGKMTPDHLLEEGAETKKKYQSFTLHVEFLLPFKPLARDQERGNSGIYIQRRYEVQVLDTFGHPAEFNGCGSMYRQHAPILNMCYPPLQWQTYDIDFTAAQFDGSGKKIHDAVITVKQNGVLVQDHYPLTNKTGAGNKEGPEPGVIWLQEHHNPVRYRNIWIVEK
ncbi:MAG TPA: DUF1080 domain-containing protein [Tepidisphaeraceae bacterium]|jgi:hypothetical protein